MSPLDLWAEQWREMFIDAEMRFGKGVRFSPLRGAAGDRNTCPREKLVIYR